MYCYHPRTFCVFDTKKGSEDDNSGGLGGGKAMLDTLEVRVTLKITQNM